ncbi:RNA polymerase sigma factor [Bacteroidia bacterium]|nr:RNA polymerase sigma factor [Bacteroidia bacterium]
MNETALIVRASLGDREAFGALVKTYQSPLRRFLLCLCGDAERSNDLAQETFIKAWLNISSFRAASRFSTWLYRIAYNTFYDENRTRKITVDADTLANHLTAATRDIDRSLDFAKALSILQGNEKTAMLLFYMEDFTFVKIAAVMSCPVGTVKSLIFRGKEKLAAYFKNEK